MPKPDTDSREIGRSFIHRIDGLISQFARLDMSDPAIREAARELDSTLPILRKALAHLDRPTTDQQ
jgi:hypothetical protein